MRPLLALLIIILTLGASGLTSAIASTVTEDEDGCCTDGEGEQPNDGSGERNECPPLCHRCACSPMFAIPRFDLGEFVAEVRCDAAPELSSQLPTSPPGRGVFHPPRRAA